MANLRLKRLKIDKFRNVAPTELHFNDGFNVLLGQNGTGKTTLLKLAAMVLSSNFSSLRHTEFAIEYNLAHLSSDLTVTLSNRPSELEFDSTATAEMMPRIGTQGESMEWSYDIEFKDKITNTEIRKSVSSNPLAVRMESSQKEQKPYTRWPSPFDSKFVFFAIFAIFRQEINEQGQLLRQAFINLLADGVVRLDEGLGCFAAITGAAADSEFPEPAQCSSRLPCSAIADPPRVD